MFNRDRIMIAIKKGLKYLPDKTYIRLYHKLRVGKSINMNNPQTLNEKLQWLKFNYRFPLQSIVSDKYLVRDYVKAVSYTHLDVYKRQDWCNGWSITFMWICILAVFI